MVTQKRTGGNNKQSLNVLPFIIVIGLICITVLINRFLYPLDSLLIDFVTPTEEDVILETRYRNAMWQGYGQVFEPIVELPVLYPNEGYKNQEFLLDSGAIVSSLPSDLAPELGYSLAMLPRVTFSGFGGTTSFAYQAETQIQLGEEEVTIPIVFTEAAGTKPILGRSGFFEKYSIYFDARTQKIQISQ